MTRVENTRFLKACRGQKVDRTPIWMMRQAGRYMPEYQVIRQGNSFLEFCKNPLLASQATLDAARILGTDAAIIFSDITLPAEAMGLPLVFEPGPVFTAPIRLMKDVERLVQPKPEQAMACVMEAIERTREGLPQDVSLIGFVGAPLTLASYMIEGTPSRNWHEFKRLLYSNPAVVEALVDKLADYLTAHATAQVNAGCDTIQLFDTNAGILAPEWLAKIAIASAEKVCRALKPLGVPVIYFAKGLGVHMEQCTDMGADVLGVDWTLTLSCARKLTQNKCALMGNLDPTALLGTKENLAEEVKRINKDAQGCKGFVFNLGHGILPMTPPENAKELVRLVHTL